MRRKLSFVIFFVICTLTRVRCQDSVTVYVCNYTNKYIELFVNEASASFSVTGGLYEAKKVPFFPYPVGWKLRVLDSASAKSGKLSSHKELGAFHMPYKTMKGYVLYFYVQADDKGRYQIEEYSGPRGVLFVPLNEKTDSSNRYGGKPPIEKFISYK